MFVAPTLVTEIITPSGSNQATTATALDGRSLCRIATDTAIYVAVGSAPNATSDSHRFLVPSGSVEYVRLGVGAKVAVATA
jgi:hypothetical protein